MAQSMYIGTSGWSYPSGAGKWAGVMYPRRWHGDELSYYAERFPSVEVNVSYYRIPSAEAVRGWIERTPPGFRFAVKLYRKFTHPEFFQREEGRSPEILPEDVRAMQQVLSPLAESGKLAALLVQYPESFHKNPETSSALARTLDHFRAYPLAVELRHPSWDDARADELLARFSTARVRLDEPFYRNLDCAIKAYEPFEYWRFHGRNSDEWRRPEAGNLRYKYLYGAEEIEELASAVGQPKNKTRSCYLYFNNHYSGMAIANAVSLARRMDINLAYDKFAHLAEYFPELRAITGLPGGQLDLLN